MTESWWTLSNKFDVRLSFSSFTCTRAISEHECGNGPFSVREPRDCCSGHILLASRTPRIRVSTSLPRLLAGSSHGILHCHCIQHHGRAPSGACADHSCSALLCSLLLSCRSSAQDLLKTSSFLFFWFPLKCFLRKEPFEETQSKVTRSFPPHPRLFCCIKSWVH